MEKDYRKRILIPLEVCRELEEYARSILPGTRLGGFAQIANEEQARESLKALGVLLGKYPSQEKKIKALAFTPSLPSGDIAHWDKSKLVLSSMEGYTVAGWAGAVASEYHHVNPGINPVMYVITHEFGHILAERSTAGSAFRRYVEARANAKGAEAREIVASIGLVSRYGRRSWAEMIAEGFATMELSPNIASDVERWAHEVLTGKGEGK